MADGAQFESDNAPFKIGALAAHPASLELKSAAGTSTVELKVMSLLQVLAEAPGQVWTREDLLDRIWGRDFIGDENLTRAIYMLRKALRDDHGIDHVIKTVPKRGYKLIPAEVPQMSKAIQRDTPHDRSIAVLPFQNMRQQNDGVFLSEGLCLDLTNLLSRIPTLRVAPNSSAIQFEESDSPPAEIASELNVRYLVTGAFQRIEHDIRIRTQLIDTTDQKTIWSHKYNAQLDDFFELQDDMVRSIATSINSELDAAEFKAVSNRRSFDLSVYEHIQAAEAERWIYNRDAGNRIVEHLRAALTIDPDNAVTHAALVGQLAQNVSSSWADDPLATVAEAKHHLKRAQEIAPNHPDVLLAAGILETMRGLSHSAVPYLTLAADLDPNNPHTRALLGWQSCALHRDAEAIDLIRSAEHDAPHHPRYAIWANYRGHAEFLLGRFEAALDAFEESAVRNPNYYNNMIAWAYPLILMGKLEAATAQIQKGLTLDPNITVENVIKVVEQHTYLQPDHVNMFEFTSLLRQAWPK